MQDYGEKEYWNQRYIKQSDQTFDWLEDYDSLRQLITQHINLDSKILIIGCGNSLLSEEMYNDGFHNIINIDISPVVINQMKKRSNINFPNMKWYVMNVLNMEFDPNTFDAVIDKSTLDTILCGEMSFYNTAVMINEIQRVLKTNGKYICVSYGTPETRIKHFNREHLSFEINCYMISNKIFINLKTNYYRFKSFS